VKFYFITELFAKVFFIVSMIIATLVLYLLALKLTGHSPSAAELNLALTTMLLGAFITSGFHTYSELARISEKLRYIERTLGCRASDFKRQLKA